MFRLPIQPSAILKVEQDVNKQPVELSSPESERDRRMIPKMMRIKRKVTRQQKRITKDRRIISSQLTRRLKRISVQ